MTPPQSITESVSGLARRRDVLRSLGALVVVGRAKAAFANESAIDASKSRTAEAAASAIANFPYKHVEVPGQDAYKRWGELRFTGRGAPVIIGGDESLVTIMDSLDTSGPFSKKKDRRDYRRGRSYQNTKGPIFKAKGRKTRQQ